MHVPIKDIIAIGTVVGMIIASVGYFHTDEEAASNHNKLNETVEQYAGTSYTEVTELKLQLDVQRAKDEIRRMKDLRQAKGGLSEEGKDYLNYWQDRLKTSEHALREFQIDTGRPQSWK